MYFVYIFWYYPWFQIQKYFLKSQKFSVVQYDLMILLIMTRHLFMYVYNIFWKDIVRTITLGSYCKFYTKCNGLEPMLLFKKANFVVTLCICWKTIVPNCIRLPRRVYTSLVTRTGIFFKYIQPASCKQ